MTTHPPQILLGGSGGTPDEIADLSAGDAVDHALADHHADRRQPGPQADVPNAAGVRDHTTRAGLLPPATDPLGLKLGEVPPRLALLQGLIERLLDVLVEMGLVLLDSQDVLAPLLDDPGGDVLLAAHGIDRDNGPLEIQ